jgi:hypothetical protein
VTKSAMQNNVYERDCFNVMWPSQPCRIMCKRGIVLMSCDQVSHALSYVLTPSIVFILSITKVCTFNSSYILIRNPWKVACILITIFRLAYRYGFDQIIFEEVLPFFTINISYVFCVKKVTESDGQDENNRRGEDITKPYGDGHLG